MVPKCGASVVIFLKVVCFFQEALASMSLETLIYPFFHPIHKHFSVVCSIFQAVPLFESQAKYFYRPLQILARILVAEILIWGICWLCSEALVS
jgi:hypothetical protein